MAMETNENKYVSVFVVICYDFAPQEGAVLKLNLFKQSEQAAAATLSPEHCVSSVKIVDRRGRDTGRKCNVTQFDPPLVTFFDSKVRDPQNRCFFLAARLGISKLYLTAHTLQMDTGEFSPISQSFVFDTHKLAPIEPIAQAIAQANAVKLSGAFFSAYGRLYYCAKFLAGSFFLGKLAFECYDPGCDTWQLLPPCPRLSEFADDGMNMDINMEILGFAVCYGYILFSLYHRGEGQHLAVAYHIETAKWHRVRKSKQANLCHYLFQGRAVVSDGLLIGHHFMQEGQIVAFSFYRDLEGALFLSTPTTILVKTPTPPSPLQFPQSESLIQLGRERLCLIQSGRNYSTSGGQYMCVTTFKIEHQGRELVANTLTSEVLRFNTDESFTINFCFTPDYKDNEPEEKDCPTEPAQSLSSEPSCACCYTKTGVSMFGLECSYRQSIDRPVVPQPTTKPFQSETVKVTRSKVAGLPMREGAAVCDMYLNSGRCKDAASCRYDHPSPGELLAKALSQNKI